MKSLKELVLESISKKYLYKAVMVQIEQLWENGFKDKAEAKKYFKAFVDGKDKDGQLMEQLFHMLDMDGEFTYDECYDEAEFIEGILKEEAERLLKES